MSSIFNLWVSQSANHDERLSLNLNFIRPHFPIPFRHWTTSLRSHVRYAHADRVFSCPRTFVSVGRDFTSVARNFEMDEILPSDANEKALLKDHEED